MDSIDAVEITHPAISSRDDALSAHCRYARAIVTLTPKLPLFSKLLDFVWRRGRPQKTPLTLTPRRRFKSRPNFESRPNGSSKWNSPNRPLEALERIRIAG
jgi:hypothetical protein